MHHFFADPTQVAEDTIFITGPDVNHMKHVLRMKPGEEVLISDGTGRDYTCEVEAFEPDRAVVRIHSVCDSRMELPAEIWLFQGLPKADKMELIIQKAVELGASAVVPVATKNAVVRLDEKKAQAKKKRWQAIAESAFSGIGANSLMLQPPALPHAGLRSSCGRRRSRGAGRDSSR